MKNILYYLPRVLTIIFICFLSLFSLDVFDMQGSFFEKLGGFFMHNIPVFILILLLLFSWKHEKKGGILFIFLGIFFTFFFKTYQELIPFLLISFPLVIIGLLFLLHDSRKKKKKR